MIRSDGPGTDRYVPDVPSGEVRTAYSVELTACFTFSINTTLDGPAGLGKDEIEEMIEPDWMWISVDTDGLLESSWQLESFEERKLPEKPD